MKKNEFTLKNNIIKNIHYLYKHPVKIGDVVEHSGFRVTVTEELIGLNPEFTDNKDKWVIQKDVCDWTIRRNHGTAFFKTKELAEKARNILGDKVKHLFN